MMSPVISEYRQIARRRRWFIAGFTLVVLVTVVAGSLWMTPVYRASALILIEKEQPNFYNTNSEAIMVESSQQDYYQTQYNILQSRTLAEKTLQKLPVAQWPELRGVANPVNWFLKSLSVEPLLNTRLVKVHFESTNPALAAQLVNALADTYVQNNHESQLFMSKDVLQSIASPGYEALPSVVSNKLIQDLKSEYARKEAQWADLSQRYTPKHPAMKRLESQMNQLRSRIGMEVDNIARAVKSELSGQLQGNNIRVIDRAEVPTQPIRPRPVMNIILGLLFGLVVGFILAIVMDRMDTTIKEPDDIEKILKVPLLGIIPFSSRLQKRIFSSDNPYLISFEHPDSLLAEAFRNIRTSIVFAGVQQPAPSLLITSAMAGEGKTLLACNLAVGFAQLGERVLIVDGHLREPYLHEVLGLPQEKGLSTLLARRENPGDFIVPTAVPGLQTIVAGLRPSNPADLLSSETMGSFMTWARQEFDRVIVDGPPAFSYSDALLLSRHVQNTVFVIQSGKTHAIWAGRACRKFQQEPGVLLGAVVNRARWEVSRYYYSNNGRSPETLFEKRSPYQRRELLETLHDR